MSANSPRLGRALVALVALSTFAVLGRTAQNLSRTHVPTAVQLAEPGELAVGTPAPAFDLTVAAGERLTLAGLRGKVVVLDFWATWCGPCRPALQRLQELYQDLGRDDLTVVAIGVSSPADEIAPYVARERLTFPVLVGNAAVQGAYRVTALPTTFVIDRQGIVRYRHVGYAPGAETSLRDKVLELLGEAAASTPPRARQP